MCLSYIRKDVCKLIVLHVIEKVISGLSVVFIARLVCTFAWFFLHYQGIEWTNKMQQEKEGVCHRTILNQSLQPIPNS